MTTSWPLGLTFNVGETNYPTKQNQLAQAVDDLYTVATTTQNLVATSSTSNAIAGSGSKTFTLNESNRNFGVGMVLKFSDVATPTNNMTGYVTAYSGNTLTATMTASSGSGTITSWSITLASGSVPITSLTPGSGTALQRVRINASGTGVECYTDAGGFSLVEQTASFSAVAGNAYVIAGNSINAALPSSPSVGDTCEFLAGNDTFTGFTITRGGNKIMGLAEDMTATPSDLPIKLTYYNASRGWIFRA